MMGLAITACGAGSINWEEEVQLSDGKNFGQAVFYFFTIYLQITCKIKLVYSITNINTKLNHAHHTAKLFN